MVESTRWSQRHGCVYRAASSGAPSKDRDDGGRASDVDASPNCSGEVHRLGKRRAGAHSLGKHSVEGHSVERHSLGKHSVEKDRAGRPSVRKQECGEAQCREA